MFKNIKNKKSGQTIIETLAASFVLAMGLASAVGLSVYALNTSTQITKQIIAIGLAREAIDAFKNMRDTNWLKQTTIDLDCYNYVTGANDDKCFKDWQHANNGFDIRPPTPDKSLILFTNNASGSLFWEFRQKQANNAVWGLNFDPNVNSVGFGGYYYSDASGSATGSSDYYRQVTITEDSSTQPYNQTGFSRLKVNVKVWWKDRRCPSANVWAAGNKCSVEMDTYLTNWKNYQ